HRRDEQGGDDDDRVTFLMPPAIAKWSHGQSVHMPPTQPAQVQKAWQGLEEMIVFSHKVWLPPYLPPPLILQGAHHVSQVPAGQRRRRSSTGNCSSACCCRRRC